MALFVDSNLKCKLVEKMSVAVEGIMESIAIEIEMGKNRNVIAACIYRAQGSKIEDFQDTFESILDTQNHHKTFLIGGDFNIDFLNQSKCKFTFDFLNALHARSLLPLITQPSRITRSCATLIDNIVTNDVYKILQSGLLINDISDHLPVFTIYDMQPELYKSLNQPVYFRVRTEKTIDEFRTALLQQDWSGVYVNDVDAAYETFLNTYISIYNKCCPMKLLKKPRKIDKPWMTLGLIKACKKKNRLYKEYVKNRTPDNEAKYKAYKNKLTTIIRKSKKDYYNKKLKDNKGNMKAT